MLNKTDNNKSFSINFSVSPAKNVCEEAETYMQQRSNDSLTKEGTALLEQELTLPQSVGDEREFTQPQSEANKGELTLPHSEAYERIDPYTMEIIAKLFPAPANGLQFLARVLRYATIVQNVLPGLEDLGEYVAVVNTRTIRTLAGMINMGYDTTHKYISTFCALGLFHKYKQNYERQLIFPLKSYTPPRSLLALDKLIAHSRPKVQQFARKVKERFIQLKLSVQQHTGASVVSTEVMGPQELDTRLYTLHSTLYNPMLQVLCSEGIDLTQGQHIAIRIVKEVMNKFIFPLKVVSTQEENTQNRVYRQADTKYHQKSTVQVYPGGRLTW
jgi:hypothetical protein